MSTAVAGTTIRPTPTYATLRDVTVAVSGLLGRAPARGARALLALRPGAHAARQVRGRRRAVFPPSARARWRATDWRNWPQVRMHSAPAVGLEITRSLDPADVAPHREALFRTRTPRRRRRTDDAVGAIARLLFTAGDGGMPETARARRATRAPATHGGHLARRGRTRRGGLRPGSASRQSCSGLRGRS